MEMHQIRYFLALSETLNFTRAAETCNVAQPSLTRAIKKLEEEFGQDLFRRERSRSHLTEFGQAMLPALRQTYESAETARKLALSYKHEMRSTLALAVSQTVDMSLISPFLAELTRVLPGLDVKLHRGDALKIAEDMKSGTVEVALSGPLNDDWDRFDMWPLFTEEFGVVVPHGHKLTMSRCVDIESLSGCTILARPYCECRDALSKLMREADVKESTTHDVPSDRDIVALVEAGLGLAIVPASTRLPDSVCWVPMHKVGVSRCISVVTVAGRKRSSAATTLINFLRSAEWPESSRGGHLSHSSKISSEAMQ